MVRQTKKSTAWKFCHTCVMGDIRNSKEFIDLYKCIVKKCPEFRDVAVGQAAIMKDFEWLANTKMSPENRIRHIIKTTNALHGMEDRRKAIMCTISKCAEAFVALEIKKNEQQMEKLITDSLLLPANPNKMQPARPKSMRPAASRRPPHSWSPTNSLTASKAKPRPTSIKLSS